MISKPKTLIADLELLRERCRIDAETGCWIWVGAYSGGAARVYFLDPISGEARAGTGTRAAWLLSGGKIPEGNVVYRSRCSNNSCVNPAHMGCGKRSDWAKAAMSHGVFESNPARAAINTRNSRSRPETIGLEKARQIRMSEGLNIEIAKAFGVSPQTVSKIRRGEAYREHVAAASIFSIVAAA